MAAKSTTEKQGTVKLTVANPQPTAPKAKAKAPKPKIVSAATPIVDAGQVKKPEFLDRALARCDIKRRDAKPAIEAALAEIAEILLAGDEVNIPPLGKIKVVKARDVGEGAKVLTLKMRSMKDGAGQGNTGVASDTDEG